MNNRNNIRRCVAVLLTAAMALGLMALSACAEPQNTGTAAFETDFGFSEGHVGGWVEPDERFVSISPDGRPFITNRLIIMGLWEGPPTTLDILPIVAERGWRVLERTSVSVTVELPATHTWYELTEMGAQLEIDYPHLISYAFPEEGGVGMFYDEEWLSEPDTYAADECGLTAIDAPTFYFGSTPSLYGWFTAPEVPPEARYYYFIPCPEAIESWVEFYDRIGHLLPSSSAQQAALYQPAWIATDRITVVAQEGVGSAQIWEFAESIGGTVIGQNLDIQRYTIGFPVRPVEEILELAERLNNGYSHFICHAWETRHSGFDLLSLRSSVGNIPVSLEIDTPVYGGHSVGEPG